ncbi:MAG: class I SAM-dependent methyltransferase [Parvularculaceae bacterium]|nr:class I SAM-dependent methyltransferase [Parvularculaceae bacterium]
MAGVDQGVNGADPSRAFGDVAGAYAELRPAYPRALYDFLEAHLEGPRETCVDLGAGPGKASLDLAERFATVAAVEPDARMLAAMPKRANIAPVQRPAEEAAFPAGRVDCVVSATAFHWMDQEVVVASVARWLRPKGVFFPFLYGPFHVEGDAAPVFARHWSLWAPYMDKRLGAKADYARSMRASGAFARLETYSTMMEKTLSPSEAAGLFFTASYARAYAAAQGKSEAYVGELAGELAPFGEIVVRFPLGGVLGIRA